MTITLEIPHGTEAQVIQKAQRLGLSVSEYARRVLEQDSVSVSLFSRLSAQERAENFLQWAENHPRDTPLLTDAEISREAIYGGSD